MDSQREWDDCLEEAAQFLLPAPLRRMFGTILLFCLPTNPLELWEKHKVILKICAR